MKPSKGLRFYHSRVLDSSKFDGKSPQLYEVTALRRGQVYYRPVYDYGTRETLGKSEYCSVETFPRIAAMPWVKNYEQFSDTDHANARLKAAAPELLEALKACVEMMDREDADPSEEFKHRDWSGYQAAVAAISKAEGK